MCPSAWHSAAVGRARLSHQFSNAWGEADASRLLAMRQCADEHMLIRGWPHHQDYLAVHLGSEQRLRNRVRSALHARLPRGSHRSVVTTTCGTRCSHRARSRGMYLWGGKVVKDIGGD
eukprot:7136844-Pyramimonas_sp.AAC.1